MADLREENTAVDTHEKTLYIQLQNIRVLCVILARLPYESVDSLYSEKCPLSFPAAVRVMDEEFLKDRTQLADNVMMNNPIPEIARENLAPNRLIHDEGNRFPDFVRSVSDFLVELQETRLVVELKCKRVDSISFVPTAFVVGLEKLGEFHKN